MNDHIGAMVDHLESSRYIIFLVYQKKIERACQYQINTEKKNQNNLDNALCFITNFLFKQLYSFISIEITEIYLGIYYNKNEITHEVTKI